MTVAEVLELFPEPDQPTGEPMRDHGHLAVALDGRRLRCVRCRRRWTAAAGAGPWPCGGAS